MKRILRGTIALMLMLILLVGFGVCTQTGLRWSVLLLSQCITGLKVHGIHGRWLTSVAFDSFEYHHDNKTLRAQNIKIVFHWLHAYQRNASAKHISILINHSPTKPARAKTPIQPAILLKRLTDLPDWQSIKIDQLTITHSRNTIDIDQVYSQHQHDRYHISFDRFKTHATIDLTLNRIFELHAQTSGELSSTLTAVGDLAHIHISGLGKFHHDTFSIDGNLSLQPNIDVKLTSTLQLNQPNIQLNAQQSLHYSILNKRWQWQVVGKGDGFVKHQSITANWHWGNSGKKVISLDGKAIQVRIIRVNHHYHIRTSIPRLSHLDKRLDKLNIGIVLSGEGLPHQLHGILTTQGGHIYLSNERALTVLASSLHWRYTPRALSLQGVIHLDDLPVHLNLILPNFLSRSLVQQTIKLRAHASSQQSAWLSSLVPEIKPSQAQWSGKLLLAGAISHLQWQSQISLDHGEFQLPGLGITLKPVTLALNGDNGDIKLQGNITSGNGQLLLQGNGKLRSTQDWQCHITAKGKQLSLLNTAQYQLVASPNLTLLLSSQKYQLTGNLSIDHGKLTPTSFSSVQSLPVDVIIIDDKIDDHLNSIPLTYDVNIELGQHLKIDSFNLKAYLTGNLTLQRDNQGRDNAQGHLNVNHGSYKLYGQKLRISKGQLNYSGGSVDNPIIDIEATRALSYRDTSSLNNNQDVSNLGLGLNDFGNDITVGLHITGQLKSPKIQLFSIPPTQNQADILSLLLLGQVASDADNAAQGQLLLAALSQLKLGGGANGHKLKKQLKHALGINQLGIENQQLYDTQNSTVTENTALVIGQSLSPHLSLKYSIGLIQPINIIRIAYQLTRHWSVQSETSSNANGIDIIYHGTSQ